VQVFRLRNFAGRVPFQCQQRIVVGFMPKPSSATLMRERPPFLMVTVTRRASASSAFSTNSFTTDAGRSTTSPAAIWLATCSEEDESGSRVDYSGQWKR